MIRRSFASLLAALACGSTATFAAPGDIDPTFGVNGVARFTIGASDDAASQLILQPDGKAIAIGVANADLALARYNVDGSLDTAFGTAGRMTVERAGNARAAVRQSDGRIVVVSSCAFGSACLHRFNADGTRDSSFDASGVTLATSDSGASNALAVQPDQKLLVTTRDFGLVRLLPSGALDTTFADNGHVSGDLAGAIATAVLVQPDGAIVVTGYLPIWASDSPRLVAHRFTPQGAVDPSFVEPSLPDRYTFNAALLQPDGRIVVAGCLFTTMGTRFAVARLLPGGALDASFQGGVFTTAIESCAQSVALDAQGRIVAAALPDSALDASMEVIRLTSGGALDAHLKLAMGSSVFGAHSLALALQPDGKTLLAGDATALATRDFALARLDADGVPDAAFGVGGVALTDFHRGAPGFLRALRAAGNGFVAMSQLQGGGPYVGQVGLARLAADGSPDASFGEGGQMTISLSQPRAGETANDLAMQGDGKILVAGFGSLEGADHAIVMRLLADGTPDTAFGSGGRASVGSSSIAHVLQVLPDGRIVVAGKTMAVVAQVFVARLLGNGSPDASFGIGGRVVLSSGSSPYTNLTIARQADGKLVVGGSEPDALSAIRLLEDGSLDASFGAGGRVILPDTNASAVATFARADGRVTLAANTFHDSICIDLERYTVAFASLDAAGSPTSDGVIESQLGRVAPYLRAARLDAQDRIVAAGSHFLNCGPGTPNTVRYESAAVFRFTPSGALDETFGTHGSILLADSVSSYGGATDVVVQPDGKLVIAAGGPYYELALYRVQGGGAVPPPAPRGDVDNDGVPDSLEAANGRDPLRKDNDIFGNANLFAMQQYRDFLGREGDSGGIAAWSGNIQSGVQTRAQVIESFFGSQEFQGTIAPVTRLYFAYFLRIPDYPGLNFWIGYFRAGNTIDAISNNFAASAEFQNAYGSLDNGQFVDLVYQNVLGRPADAGGRAFWKNELDTNARTRGQVMLGFSESDEYRGSSDSMVYVTMMYFGMMRRAPDPQGFDFWVGYRNAGNSGQALIDAFLGSQEYHSRFLP